MRKTWKQILLGALTLCVLASGCGGGKGGGGTPEDPNADLPVRKKISTPVASSFKVDGRTAPARFLKVPPPSHTVPLPSQTVFRALRYFRRSACAL